MKLQYFTFFLNQVRQESLFKDTKIDRLNSLRDALKRQKIEYLYRGTKMAYVFVSEHGNFILGRIGKKSALRRNLPPENRFQETTEETWPFCSIVFSLDQDSRKGQKIAFELKSWIFTSPFEQLKALADALNPLLVEAGCFLSINPVIKEQKFWDLIKNYKGKIEKVSFTFNAPNLFGLDNSLNDDLSNAKKKYGINKATIELENSDGNLEVPEDDELMKQGADYIARGGGDYSIKIKGRAKRVIKSKDSIETKTLEIDDLEISAKTPGIMKDVFKDIFG